MDAFKLNCAKKLCAMLVCVLPFIHWIQNNFHVQTMLNINKKYHIIHNNTYIKHIERNLYSLESAIAVLRGTDKRTINKWLNDLRNTDVKKIRCPAI